jgi:GAF domain-containing protein
MSNVKPAVLSALLSIRLGEASLDEVLGQLAVIAQKALAGVDEVSITLVRADKPYTAAHTGQLALDADELQYERGYGPCIDAGLSGTVLLVPDMREETRWPDYAAAVVPRGVRGSVSIPLPLQTELIGALNCYSRTPNSIHEEIDLGVELAAHVAVAAANAYTHTESARQAEDMANAMSSRAVIEQAKGMIMAQNRCDAATAFEILRRASMGRNVKLRDVATDMVAAVSNS